MALLKAHLDPGDRGIGHPRSVAGSLDAETRACVGCHDGTIASDGSASRGQASLRSETGADHPVGIEYRAGLNKGELRLRPRTRLNQRVRLFDGTVGCGSCHSVYSRQANLLVENNQGSALCMSCHDQ